MIRLFVALNLDVDIKERLRPFYEGLDMEQAKVVPIENLHISLKFLGYAEEDLLPEIKAVLNAVAKKHRPFNLSLDRLGAFPSKKRARVFWIGAGENKEATVLATEMDEGFEKLGFEREKRAYKVHLTLSRFKKPTDVTDLVQRRFGSIKQKVGDFSLFESKLSSKGAQYREVEKFVLKNA